MLLLPNQVADVVPKSSKVAERLLAHARLCRQIAGQSWNEDIAAKLKRMAEDCERAVAELADAGGPAAGTLH